MRTIYFVRHGEAQDDVESRFGGWADDHLTANGEENAHTLALRLKTFPIDKIFSSSFQRAAKTADIIGKELGKPVTLVDDLRERNRYGKLTSMKIAEANEKFPEIVKQVQDYFQTVEGAETYENYRTRVLGALHKIFQETTHDNILIVCHGGTFRVVMWELLQKPAYDSADLNAVIEVTDNGKLELKTSQGLFFKT